MGNGAGGVRAVLGMALLATLAGCGGQEPAVEAPRPVLVMHPAAGADTAPAAYAGDIRARNESPLSFRVGGNLVKRLVDFKLNAVGLLAAADAYPRELSGGMARRVALARALALDPPLMIYDEPLTGLDPIASGVIMSLIQRLNDTLGLTSIIVSHHVHETLPIADQAVVIANGGIVFSGTPSELEASTDPLVRQFLRGEPDGPIAFDASPRTEAA